MLIGDIYIHPKLIQNALDVLIFTYTQRSIPHILSNLHLTSEYLRQNGLTPTQHNRDYALKQILTDTISSEYLRLRGINGLATQFPTNKLIALNYLTEDRSTGNDALIDYAVLFYRYVLSDFSIQIADLELYLAYDERTIRRHKKRGCSRLANLLKQREVEALRSARLIRLNQKFRRQCVKLYGRDRELNILLDAIRSKSEMVFITGEVGVGKTAFVASAIEFLTSELTFNHIIWIESCDNLTILEQELRQQLGIGTESQLQVSEDIDLSKVLVIVENINIHPESVLALLNRFSAIILTCRKNYALAYHNWVFIHLNELSELDSYKLAYDILASRHHLPADKVQPVTEKIAHEAQGNPALIKLQAQYAIMGQNDYVEQSFTELYAGLFGQLAHYTQKAWVLCALSPNGSIPISSINFCPLSYHEAFFELEHYRLIYRDDKTASYRLDDNARRLIKEYPRDYHMIISVIQILIDEIDEDLSQDMRFGLGIVEEILIHYPSILGLQRYKRWVRAIWPNKQTNPTKWRVILEQLAINGEFEDEFIRVAYANCLRRLGEVSDEQLPIAFGQNRRNGQIDL